MFWAYTVNGGSRRGLGEPCQNYRLVCQSDELLTFASIQGQVVVLTEEGLRHVFRLVGFLNCLLEPHCFGGELGVVLHPLNEAHGCDVVDERGLILCLLRFCV